MSDSSEVIRAFADQLGLTSAQAADVTRSLEQLSRSAKATTTATDAEYKAIRDVENSYRELKSSMSTARDGMTGLANGMYGVTSSVSNTGAAFTAIVPVLDLMQASFNRAIDAFGLGISSLAAALPVAGDAAKSFSDGMRLVSKETASFLFGLAKQQISAVQGLLQNYIQLSNTGMIFGGSMEEATKRANEAGMSLETFTGFATKNAEALAALSGNSQTSAVAIAKAAKNMDLGMVELYGGFENLASAIADYQSLQTRMGVNAVASQKQLEDGAKAYLLQQKELALITGKSAAAQKSEMERRLQTASFANAMSKKLPEEQRNIMAALADVQAKYGEDGARQLMERVSNEGELLAQSANQYAAFNAAQDDAIKTIYENTSQSEASFKTFRAQLIQDTAPFIKAQNDMNADILKLAGSGYLGEIGAMFNRTAAASIASTSAQENAVQAQKDASINIAAAAERTSSAVGGIIKELETFKIGMNDLTVQFLPQTQDLVSGMYTVAKTFQDQLKSTADVMEYFNGKIGLLELKSRLGLETKDEKQSGVVSNTPVANTEGGAAIMYPKTGVKIETKNVDLTSGTIQMPPSAAPTSIETPVLQDQTSLVDKLLNAIAGQNANSGKNLQKNADGGITQGKEIAGEDGPEAVIPLKNGSIPLNIDFSPLSAALEKQTDLTSRLIDEVRDSKDIQRQILNASY